MDSVTPISAAFALKALRNGGDMRWYSAYMLAENKELTRVAEVAYDILSENNGKNDSMNAILDLSEEDVGNILIEDSNVFDAPLKIRLKYFISLLLFSLTDANGDDESLHDSVLHLYKFLVEKGINLFAFDVATELGDRSTSEETFCEAERHYLIAIHSTQYVNGIVPALMGYAALLGNPDGGKPDEDKELIALGRAAGHGCMAAMWAAAMIYMERIDTTPNAANLAQRYFDRFIARFTSNEPYLPYDNNVGLFEMHATAHENLARLHMEGLIDNADPAYGMQLLRIFNDDEEDATREEKEQWLSEDLAAMDRPEEDGDVYNWVYVLEALGLEILGCEQIEDHFGVATIALENDGDDELIDTIDLFVVAAIMYQDPEGALFDEFESIISNLKKAEKIDLPFLVTSSFAVFREVDGCIYTPVLLVTETENRLISLYPGMGTDGMRSHVYGSSPFIDGESYSTTANIAFAINQLAIGKSLADDYDNATYAEMELGWSFPLYDEFIVRK